MNLIFFNMKTNYQLPIIFLLILFYEFNYLYIIIFLTTNQLNFIIIINFYFYI